MNLHHHVGDLPTRDIPNCEKAIESIYTLAGAHGKDALILTEDRAEAVAHVLYGHYFDELVENGKNHFLTLTSEDAPIVLTLQRLERVGCFGKKCRADEIERYITPRTGLVTLSWAQTLTGVIHPIEEIANVCAKHDVPLHVDATPVMGKVPIEMKELPIDYLTMGPAVFVAQGRVLGSLIGGRPKNPEKLFAFGKTCEELMRSSDYEAAHRRDQFEKKLCDRVGARVLCGEDMRLPGISAVEFPGFHAELLAFHLKHEGIDVTFGGGQYQRLENLSPSALSFCIEGDVDTIVEKIGAVIDRLEGLKL